MKKFEYDYAMPSITVDCCVFHGDQILLIKRRDDPFKDCWALPGGFMNMNETSWQAVEREVREETGISLVSPATLRRTGLYDTVNRDPRGRVVSIAFISEIGMKQALELKAGDDAADAAWYGLNELPALAFDHATIIKHAIEQRKNK